MPDHIESIADLNRSEKAHLALDLLQRIIVHYAMWFNETRHQLGPEKALDVFQTASSKSLAIQMKRLGEIFGFELQDGIPAPLAKLPEDKMQDLLEALAKNWVANDGVWFQAVEFAHDMYDAKRCNDTCWAHFSPFEAWSIKKFLGLPDAAGLEGLKRGLRFRLYALINQYSIIDEGPHTIQLQMNACRVQVARKRRGLDDYPCKSAGVVEYTSFAEAIDPRIKTECLGCPPDHHPEEWFCAWRFSIDPQA